MRNHQYSKLDGKLFKKEKNQLDFYKKVIVYYFNKVKTGEKIPLYV